VTLLRCGSLSSDSAVRRQDPRPVIPRIKRVSCVGSAERSFRSLPTVSRPAKLGLRVGHAVLDLGLRVGHAVLDLVVHRIKSCS
jgi:hypothetical protein